VTMEVHADGRESSRRGVHNPSEEDLRVSTLEIFFDVVFVLTLMRVSSMMGHHLTIEGTLQTALVFIALFWMYGAYAYLTNQVPPDQNLRRYLMIFGMAGFLICAVAVPDTFGESGVAFGLGYLAVVLVHAALYAQTYGWPVLLRFVPPNVASALCITAAGLFDGTVAYILWALPVLTFFITPYFNWTAEESKAIRINTGHFVERHGLLLIIVIGESIVALGLGIQNYPIDIATIVAVVLGIALAAAFWWCYFVEDAALAERILTDQPVAHRLKHALSAYFYAFVPMLLGIVTVAAGMHETIGHLTEHLHLAPALALAGGVALFLIGAAAFRVALRIRPFAYRLITAVLAFGTIPLGMEVSALAQLVALPALIIAMLVLETDTQILASPLTTSTSSASSTPSASRSS